MNKNIFTISLAFLICLGLKAQVEFEKKVSENHYGVEHIIKKAPKKVIICEFDITFKTSTWIQGKEGLKGVGKASILLLNEKLAQEISNEAFLYAFKQFEAHDYEVVIYDVDKVNSSKTFSKEKSKGRAKMNSGGVDINKSESPSVMDATMVSHASGSVNVSFKNDQGMIPLKFAQDYFGKEPLMKFTFSTGLGMLDENTLSCEEYGGIPAIEYTNSHQNFVGMLFHCHGLKYKGNEWITKKEEKKEPYGESINYSLNANAFKKACLEMLKVYIDQSIETFITERDHIK